MASTVGWTVLADRAAQCPALGLPGWRSVSDAPIVPRHHAGTEFPKESSRSSCPALQHFDRVQQDAQRERAGPGTCDRICNGTGEVGGNFRVGRGCAPWD